MSYISFAFNILYTGETQPPGSHVVGTVNLEPNRHLVDKIMMLISSVGGSDFYLWQTTVEWKFGVKMEI